MDKALAVLLATLVVGASVCCPAQSAELSVTTYHGDRGRSGSFVVPALTWDRARLLRLDENFRASASGHVYAQPLYWRASGSNAAMLVVATEDNVVHGIDARTGNEIWNRSLGKPVPRSSLPCGNISPLGITGTPVIDPGVQLVYLDAAVEASSGPRHLIFALSLKDGATVPGWPIDVMEALGPTTPAFIARDQNQRGALALLADTVFVPFGGHFGDCGQYHGFVVGVSVSQPRALRSWATRARGGGIWAPGGLSSDGASLFAATGNTIGAASWSDGEAILRLAPDLHRSDDRRDFFAPSDWPALDARDADLGGSNPLPLDVGETSQALLMGFGKDGKAYVLDRNNLGGIGGQLAVETVSERSIITAPASYPSDDGSFVAFSGDGARCPAARSRGLVALKISGSPPAIRTAWCATVQGRGSAMVTTTDGRADPIVWILGAEGDNKLHGFRGDTGEPLFSGPPLSGLRRFQTLIATEDRLYAAADGKIYAFAF
jgi:outer membrane protein assembly factor BamB